MRGSASALPHVAEAAPKMPELFTPFDSALAWRVIVVGALTNVACSLVGCYLVLRRMSLMGDAISHAVLPGLVLAFLFSGTLHIVPMFVGAIAVGLLTTFLTQSLHQFGRVPTDASMGVVFTSLFALGVVLLKRYIEGAHFDSACVYEGSLQFVSLDTIVLMGFTVPRAILTIGPVVLMNLVVIGLFWKELKISSFDPGLATAMGFSATVMHYLLMALVAVTTVASFEAVGSILVVAMLIVPPATAHLLSDRLGHMMLLACLLSVVTSVLGYWLADRWDVAPAGTMTVVAGAFYGLAVLFSPRYGILSTLLRNLNTSLRIIREDILSMLYRLEELGTEQQLDRAAAVEALGGGMLANWGVRSLIRAGQVVTTGRGLALTDAGRFTARNLVRSHRLWEAYLVQHLQLPPDHVHDPAHRVEHFIGEQMQRELEEAVEDRALDPHGRNIPE